VVYADVSGGSPAVKKIGIDGGVPVSVSKDVLYFPVVSPDGKSIAAEYLPDLSKPAKLAIVGIDGGEIRSAFDEAPDAKLGGEGGSTMVWTKDGRAVLFIVEKEGASNLWAQPVGSPGTPAAPAKRIMNVSSEQVWAFALSPDGKQIVCARGLPVTDAVLISHFH